MSQYERHVFVCEGKHCARADSDAVHAALKKGIARAGLKGRVRINRAGCLGQCGHGPMAVVYPEGVWYGGLDAAAARRVAEEHLVGARVVGAHRYVAQPGDHKVA